MVEARFGKTASQITIKPEFRLLAELEIAVKQLIINGERNVSEVADMLQHIVDQPQFELIVDLGIIAVPDDYDHAKCLTAFRKKQNRREKLHTNEHPIVYCREHLNITDANFPFPSRILKPGDKLRARVFGQATQKATSSSQRMAFLRERGAVFLGAQGLTLIFEQKCRQLPRDGKYISFDELDNLWRNELYYHQVPFIAYDADNDFAICHIDMEDAENQWGSDFDFLCFTDI